ncbi:MAG: T9SS type A sorting domain-containing protein [archaeon]|nr:T9SS type A sorting domain-containing protein [archaeon]
MGKLRSAVIGGLTALLIGIGAGKAGAESLGTASFSQNRNNPYIQPNDSTLVYYGSGDVNKDRIVNLQDYELISQGTYNDQSDINGDGIQTNEDLTTLNDFLTGRKPYLPSDWNKLKTKEERIDWLTKMFAIDKTNEIRYIIGKWECDEFTNQTYINFSGHENTNISSKYSKQNNGRFNIPLYHARIKGENDFEHSVNAVLVGDNPLDFNDWYFIEPQDDIQRKIETSIGTFPANSQVTIRSIYQFINGSTVAYVDQVKFNINGNRDVSLDENSPNPNLITQRPGQTSVAEETGIPAESALSQNYPNPFNGSTAIEYSLEKPGKVRLEVFNIAGQRLETIVDGNQTAGNHKININLNGRASGTYFCKLRVGDNVETRKMSLVK